MNDSRAKIANVVLGFMPLLYPTVPQNVWGTDAIKTDPEASRLRGSPDQILEAPFLYPADAEPGDTRQIFKATAGPKVCVQVCHEMLISQSPSLLGIAWRHLGQDGYDEEAT